MNGRPPSRWDQPTVKALLVSTVAGAFIAEFSNLPLAIRLALLGVMATCLVLIFPNVFSSFGRAVCGFVRQLWWLLAPLAGIILLVVFLHERGRPALPEEVLDARHEVIEIESRLRHAKKVLLFEEGGQRPPRRALMEGYDIVLIEGGGVLRTYLRQGKKIAEDVEGEEPCPFARRYFQGRCNFATDYFDRRGAEAYLEYRQGCRGGKIVFDPTSPLFLPPSPNFLPPVPSFIYR